VFGYLGGAETPFTAGRPELNFILALRSLPIVIVFSALAAVLWHWRVTPLAIRGFSRLLQRAFGIGGAVGLSSAANIFVGMVEAPLIVRPHLARMTSSDLFVLMTCGMASVAGTVMGLYAAILAPVLPDALSHILVASVISAPAAIMLAMMMKPVPAGTLPAESGDMSAVRYDSTTHAITEGTADGMRLLLNIVAMLIVFVALVSLVNQALGWLSGGYALSLQTLGGWCLRPLAWAIGIPWPETQIAGELLATKVILNELVAYIQLAGEQGAQLGAHSRLVMTYALCGFANFGSLGIMLGGLTAMCPERRSDIVRLAPLSIWSGLLATCMTAAVVALLVPA
jgi:concentrative nucleoside transporter, CNT family